VSASLFEAKCFVVEEPFLTLFDYDFCLDVIRNEMFKTNKSLPETVKLLHAELGNSFLTRGLGKNMVAVAIPVGCTIFFTDMLIQFSRQ
jgi:hypothetical protein